MNSELINRFTVLSEKIVSTDASNHELKEFKQLLNSLNQFVEYDLPQTINHARTCNNNT
jgi:hypothetical protein